MAHKKGQGSSHNGRNSNAQRRGVKPSVVRKLLQATSSFVSSAQNLLLAQTLAWAKTYTLFALKEGVVEFDKQGRRVNIREVAVA